MNITTNRLKITFNLEAIQEDFAFIRLERQEQNKWCGFSELDDLMGEDFKATATLYEYGKYAYVMFRKPIISHQLLNQIRDNEAFEKDAVTEVISALSADVSQPCICGAWLAQILLNSLASSNQSRFTQYHFNNLTGKLLMVLGAKSKKKDALEVAQISLDKDFLLQVNIKTYRTRVSILTEIKKTKNEKRKQELQKALKKPHYQYHFPTNSLRRSLTDENQTNSQDIYIECGITGKKASVPFFEFNSMANFEKSRLGIIANVISLIQEKLSEYMTIDYSSYEVTEKIRFKNKQLDDPIDDPKKIRAILENQQQIINIVDKVNTEDSSSLVESIKEYLLSYLPDPKRLKITKKEKKGALNLIIIHEKSYYEQNDDLKDPYQLSDKEYQRQHITIESIESQKDIKAIVLTIVKEMIIKCDLARGSFSLYDWSQLNPKGVWTFADWDEETNRLIFMKIQPNGQFEFDTIDVSSLDLFNHQDYERYQQLIIDPQTSKKITNLEGLVISENQDINLIFRTEEISIPDVIALKTMIKEVETPLPASLTTPQALASLIEEFMAQEGQEIKPEDLNKLRQLIESLKNSEMNKMNKNDFKKSLNKYLKETSKIHEKFRKFLLSEKQIRLIFSKSQNNPQLNFSCNINYFGETETEAYYVVGNRDINKYSIKTACHLRRLKTVDQSRLVFQKLLLTMDVDFVKTKQTTVLPFPFKYIREYIQGNFI